MSCAGYLAFRTEYLWLQVWPWLWGLLLLRRLCGAGQTLQSMNTVMDDNKMLTLASNERIPLAPSMRLLLEINHMNHCSPATVSRGGVIYINAEDVGWKPARAPSCFGAPADVAGLCCGPVRGMLSLCSAVA